MDEADVANAIKDSFQPAPYTNGAARAALNEEFGFLLVETWREFESKALDHVPVLVDRLWPEAAFGFIAAPPKKGKTWLALSLALSLAAGKPFLGHFAVPNPRPVLYVALEGHRAGLRARVGALAHGLGINPDTDDLTNLHWLYKPQGINLADPEWARLLHIAAAQVEAALVIVDVLRASARLKENDQEAFSILRRNLEPITDNNHSLALLHHFGKLTETQKERDPGERMSGSGAMFGALDVAVYITGSDNNARSLRLEFDSRDIAAPERISVTLTGDGTGENGGLTYRDHGEWRLTEEIDEDDLKAPSTEIAEYVRNQGGRILAKDVRAYFAIGDHTLTRRLSALSRLGIDYSAPKGKPAWLIARIEVQPDPEPQLDLRYESTSAMADVGGESHNHPALTSATPSSAIDPRRTAKSGDLQDKPDLRTSALPTGEPDDVADVAELPEDAGPPDDDLYTP